MFNVIHERRRYVNTLVWNTEQNPDHFPEAAESSPIAVPWLKDKKDFGLAFSGGGTRAASATLGQLRGLRKKGLLKDVKYISAVSGGSWAVTPFTYLPETFTDEEFLGEAVNPENLTLGHFEELSERSLASAISNTVITDDFFKEALLFSGDETYSRAIGNLFLEPFELDNIDKFFTFHKNALMEILKGNKKRNDRYYLTEGDFYLAREKRPYLIVGATILRLGNDTHNTRKIHCEYTPLYTGIRSFFDRAGRSGKQIGGGYVETFAYDSRNPSEQQRTDGRWKVKVGRRRNRFTLSDMIGSSGAAPREILDKLLLKNIGFPEFHHWPISDIGKIDEEEYAHGDGGHLENLGIMPLLARKVKNIIVFINGKTPFNADEGQYSGSIRALFEPVDDFEIQDILKGQQKFDVNIVFEEKKLEPLLDAFKERQSKGETLIHWDEYEVKQNDNYKIRPYTARICWIYNDKVENWNKKLGQSNDLWVKKIFESQEFSNFPHYRTFLQNPPKIIDLSKRQVSALSHLSCWNVCQYADKIKKYFQL